MPDTSQLRIEAAHKKISDVFSKSYAFTIPAYQRPYAWETTQVEELLADLTEAMAPTSKSDGFYFLGSIVLVKKHGSPESRVVDGQQRLTTLTILFSVIRDLTADAEKRISREKYVKQVANEDEGTPKRSDFDCVRRIRPILRHIFRLAVQLTTFPRLMGCRAPGPVSFRTQEPSAASWKIWGKRRAARF